MYLYLNNPVKHEKKFFSGKKWVPHMYIRMGSQYSDFEWFQSIFGRFWAQNSSKIVPENVFEPQGTFLGGVMVIFRVFLAQFGLFLSQNPSFPNFSQKFYGQIQGIFGHFSAQKSIENVSKKVFEPPETFWGVFWSLSGCFWVNFGAFLGQKPEFPLIQLKIFWMDLGYF